MASIAGLLGPETATIAASGRWERCLSYLGSRTRAAVLRSDGRSGLLAYGGDEGGFFENDRCAVMLDGSVDNLRELDGSGPNPDRSGMTSDAEAIAGLFSRRGESILGRFTGSFALALVLRDSGEVILVRDPFGARPLFYAASDAGWAWASEIKGLLPVLDRVGLDREGLRQSLHYRWVLGETLIEGVRQVMPACMVRLAPGSRPVESLHWKLEFRPSEADGGVGPWADRVDAGLDACFARLRARYRDVGVLLSGGVDSSLLALKAARAGFRNCVAVTARWPGHNPELKSAIAVARHLGIEHRIVDVDESYIEESFPRILWRMEEPPRHLNSFILSRLFEASSGRLETLLHGEAADALFGPMENIRVRQFQRRRSLFGAVPRPLGAALAGLLPAGGGGRLARVGSYLRVDTDRYMKTIDRIDYGSIGPEVFGQCLGPDDPGRRCLDLFDDPSEEMTERFQRLHLYTFCESHLTVLDRLSAPTGVPATMPFLSPELVAIATELPTRLKAEGGTAKPVLKALAARSFPREWIYRRKQGFPTHTSRWLRGPLDCWAKILDEDRTVARGLLDTGALGRAEVGRDDEVIWTSMCLEMFCRQFLDGEGGPRATPMRVQGS